MCKVIYMCKAFLSVFFCLIFRKYLKSEMAHKKTVTKIKLQKLKIHTGSVSSATK